MSKRFGTTRSRIDWLRHTAWRLDVFSAELEKMRLDFESIARQMEGMLERNVRPGVVNGKTKYIAFI